MLLGADQTEEHGCHLSEVTQPFVQKASCSFIMLGQLPQCALGTLSTAQPTASTFQTPNLTAHLDAREWELIPQPFLLLSDSPPVHCLHQNPALCDCVGLGEG